MKLNFIWKIDKINPAILHLRSAMVFKNHIMKKHEVVKLALELTLLLPLTLFTLHTQPNTINQIKSTTP